ncbi:MAG: lipase family protein [Rhodococcus sp. (in: high G+C Gram-positive bacteria)]|uniref:lipase family protein n=1 Tax=Rhodococcus sp. TaxID=1831 RepID=UPI003BB56EF0
MGRIRIGWAAVSGAAVLGGAVLGGALAPTLYGPTAVTARADPAPGSVIDVRSLPGDLSLPGAAVAERIEYHTQMRSGAPTVGTGVLFLPPGPAPAEGRPVVAWTHGTYGIGDDCAPSTRPRGPRDSAYLDHWLDQGYAVVAADYPGLGTAGVHTYLDGPSAANSVVDIVRAARAVEPGLSDRWVVIGQSQGGHAALHTAHLATTRAPELDFRGTVTTGAPANLELLFPLGFPGFPDLGLDGLTEYSGYLFAGLRAARPDLDVNSYLSPLGVDVVDAAETLCYDAFGERYGDVGVGQLLARPLGDDRFRSAFADYVAVPTAGYDRPLFIGQGLRDTMVPAPLSGKLAVDLTVGGADLHYRTYPGGHGDTMSASLPDTTPFVAQLFAG